MEESRRKMMYLLMLSLSPLLVGYFFHYMSYNHGWYGTILSIMNIIFCVYWFYVGYRSFELVDSRVKSIIVGNLFGIITVILVLLQTLIMERFMVNFLGHASQVFFFPMVRPALWVENILFFFTTITRIEVVTVISLILMIILYNAGYVTRLKREHSIEINFLSKQGKERAELFLKGLTPFGLGLIFMLFGMLLNFDIDVRIIRRFLNLLSLALIFFWGCIGYEIGKEKGVSPRNIFYTHIVSMVLVILQIYEITNSIDFHYGLRYIIDLFFLPTLYVLEVWFGYYMYREVQVLLSIVIMLIVFTIGMFLGKRCGGAGINTAGSE